MISPTNLKACVEKRKKQPVVTPEVLARSLVVSPKPLSNNIHSISTPSEKERVVKKSISTGFLSALESVDSMNTSDVNRATSPTTKRYAKLHPFRQAVVFIDNVRDKVREDIRNLLHGLRALFKVHIYIYIYIYLCIYMYRSIIYMNLIVLSLFFILYDHDNQLFK
jgi:hypothetical protein